MKKTIRVVQMGLGPIGQSCVKILSTRPGFELVGAVDIRPEWIGRDVAEICGVALPHPAHIFGTAEDLLKEIRPDAVLHTAGSRASTAFTQCRPWLEAGMAVVSSCEELLYPWHRAPEEADEMDALCRKSGGRILGTGVNPGFVLDVLPAVLSMVAASVRGVKGRRIVNASLRREPLQRKIGSGLPPEEFRRAWQEGKAGHAGFQESLLLLAHAFGWKVENLEETLEPVVAEKEIKTDFFHVPCGATRGLHQTVRAVTTCGFPIELDLVMALDEPNPGDSIELLSDPPLRLEVPGGVSGDLATVAALVHSIPRLLASSPGVRLSTELPISAATRG